MIRAPRITRHSRAKLRPFPLYSKSLWLGTSNTFCQPALMQTHATGHLTRLPCTANVVLTCESRPFLDLTSPLDRQVDHRGASTKRCSTSGLVPWIFLVCLVFQLPWWLWFCPTKSLDGCLAGSLDLYHKSPVLFPKRMFKSDARIPPTPVKAEPQNDDRLPKKAVGAKQRHSIDFLVEYGTDDEDTVEESPPLSRASSSVEVPRGQEATTEDAEEIQTTITMSDSVVKIESPTSSGLKVCAL
jgi:hypothetical protein